MGKQKLNARKVLKACVVLICLFGFLWQTLEFYFLYETYPTVVDIQVSVPAEFDIPGITICSSNGMNPEVICDLTNLCVGGITFKIVDMCSVFPELCENGKVPPYFKAVRWSLFVTETELNKTLLDQLRVPLEDFFKCTITGGTKDRPCDTENVVIGSYYSDSNIPSFCFTLNSKWGNPNRRIQTMKKTEKIEMEFYVDISYGDRNAPPEQVQRPKFNPVSGASVQLVLHSQKMTRSPYKSGKLFYGGKKYQVKVAKDEKHLLPPPYQTNCTDYAKDWLARGGLAPLNQVMTVQECRMKAALDEIGCVPYSVDYPHNYTLCRYCSNCANETRIGSFCTDLLQSKNQPCESENYDMFVEERWVYILRAMESKFLEVPEYNCSKEKIFSRQCQTINIELNFEDYEITNVTYNPKFESLELFSVIGGYMGMYLGISLVAVYDFLEEGVVQFYRYVRKSKKSKMKPIRKTLKANSSERILPFNHHPSEFRRRQKWDEY